MLAQLREKLPEFEKAGVNLACIVHGDAEETRELCGRHGMAEHCIGDPEKSSYRSMGFPKMRLRDLIPSADLRRRRAEASAAGCGISVRGSLMKNSDVRQLGGAALIDVSGRILWMYGSVHPGDLPNASALLEVVRTRGGQGCPPH